jgi:hypothetical protein
MTIFHLARDQPFIETKGKTLGREGYGTDLTFISWNLLNQAPFVHHDGPSPPELNSIQTFSTLKCI